jgi:hypothetical protein
MPTTSPSPTATPNPAHVILNGFWRAATNIATHEPWLVAFFALVLLTAMVRSARVAIHTGPRDPVRLFSRADKVLLLARAGHRCEFHGLIGGRCRSMDLLEADHVHPWSRGGATHVRNGQILCRTHNRDKSAAIPWDRSLRKLADRRAAYYPHDVDRAIVRRPSRKATAAAR